MAAALRTVFGRTAPAARLELLTAADTAGGLGGRLRRRRLPGVGDGEQSNGSDITISF